MININCNDDFLKDNIVNLLDQKKFFLNNSHNIQYFFQSNIIIKEKNLEISTSANKLNLNLPLSFNEFFEKFFDMISNEKVYLQSYEYYPFKQLIKKNEKNIFLSEIQNTIMYNLLLNSESGIKKTNLIKTIWPSDKDIFFNKLDTHLTNLKNHLNEEIGFDLRFSSKFGVIKLVIN